MYSGLRKNLSAPRISHPSYFVGLLLRGCLLPHPNFGHVVLAKPSPILFYPISSTEVRFPQRPSAESSWSDMKSFCLALCSFKAPPSCVSLAPLPSELLQQWPPLP